MDLLLDSERAAVLRYYHVRDAKLALGSALLKRLLIAQHIPGLAWDAATAVRDAHTKPVFYHPAGTQRQPLLFNVSHQAGLVVVLAAHGAPEGTQVGVDVVCPGERRARDLDSIQADGWAKYVDMHDSVLSPVEAGRLRALPPAVEAGGLHVGGGRGQEARVLLHAVVPARGVRQDDGRGAAGELAGRLGDAWLCAARGEVRGWRRRIGGVFWTGGREACGRCGLAD